MTTTEPDPHLRKYNPLELPANSWAAWMYPPSAVDSSVPISDDRVAQARAAIEAANPPHAPAHPGSTTPPPEIPPPEITPPQLTAITPTHGPSTGGTIVVATGSNLTGATALQIGGTDLGSFSADSDAQVSATDQGQPQGGPYDVSVVTPNGTATLTGAWTSD